VRGGVGVWQDHWLFWIAPFVGGIAGSLLYEYTLRDDWVLQKKAKEHQTKDLFTDDIQLQDKEDLENK